MGQCSHYSSFPFLLIASLDFAIISDVLYTDDTVEVKLGSYIVVYQQRTIHDRAQHKSELFNGH